MPDRTEPSLLLSAAAKCCTAAVALLDATRLVVAPLCAADAADGVPDAHQIEAHGYAWMATYVRALQQMLAWAIELSREDRFGELEHLIMRAVFAEYLSQLADGIPMNQTELVRPAAIGTPSEIIERYRRAVSPLTARGDGPDARLLIAEIAAERLAAGMFGDLGLDETHGMIRDSFRRFAKEEVQPFAQQWHRDDVLIPMTVVSRMAEMGAFGLSIPEEFGGSGLGKLAMAVMSEELSRGYIGVGSLGTRSEIAAELIRLGGTAAQKEKYLPRIASGAILPTAVFTEPDTGSDLGSLSTRAVPTDAGYAITGAKTWITHASRSDLMTVLVRTGPASLGYRSLSMFLAEKVRGTDDEPFPTPGMTGGEIKVLGYRGMKEYELAFDGFAVPRDALLGEVEGNGFKQLMATFESARVQTAARAVGVAQNALELGLGYALDRFQFGKAIIAFPRVAAKIGWMVAETMVARQLTYFAAREKDEDRRSDVEAGMAKLLAARVAWANADNALQIHGGNGYAEEYPISRVLCDARILNIFEGAAEIQAQVIARRLLATIEPV